MKLTNDADYRQALDRANALRSKDASVEEDPELAELEAAIMQYEAAGDGLGGERKGRPGNVDTDPQRSNAGRAGRAPAAR